MTKRKKTGHRKRTINLILIFVVVVLLGIYAKIIEKSKNEIKQQQVIENFLKLDDIAHEWIADGRERWEHYEGWEELFYEIDEKFHNAKNIEDKITYAKEMDKFMENVDQFIDRSWYLKTDKSKERDRKYDDIKVLFDAAIK